MLIDLEKVDGSTSIEADICVIGAGVAGQTFACALKGTNLKVVLLESGDKDFRRDTEQLSDGQNLGFDYYDLKTSHLRMFGGTAAIWGGRCAELDDIDFEKRDFLPHSGWPVTKSDLDPYYAEAFDQLGLERPVGLWEKLGQTRPPFDTEKIEAGLWVFDEKGERFAATDQPCLEHCDIVLNATVTEIAKSENGEVHSVTARSLKDTVMTVKAKTFVLAAGAIQSARLLLAAGGGLGNQHDQLGRYFMEHPHARGGEVITDNVARALTLLPRALRRKGKRYAAYMRPSEDFQREEGILNTSLSLTLRRREGEKMESYRSAVGKLKHDLPSSRLWRQLYHGAKALAVRGLEATDPWSSVLNHKLSGGKTGIFAVIRAEQSPNPDSRVLLSEERDELGMPKANLDWQLQEIDRYSVRRLMETLKDEFTRLGFGDVKPSEWLYDSSTLWKSDPLISAHPIGGYHHMGGLRMSAAPKHGVVDANCRVHNSPNLYVAGSSVFPTGGWANPTITIMALALRLADHLGHKAP
ncbi:GMC family oxidoreductase [Hellea sp.]|nr:GMC family oxidoreductase [Hellea sp.]